MKHSKMLSLGWERAVLKWASRHFLPSINQDVESLVHQKSCSVSKLADAMTGAQMWEESMSSGSTELSKKTHMTNNWQMTNNSPSLLRQPHNAPFIQKPFSKDRSPCLNLPSSWTCKERGSHHFLFGDIFDTCILLLTSDFWFIKVPNEQMGRKIKSYRQSVKSIAFFLFCIFAKWMLNKSMFAGRFHVNAVRCKHLYSQVLEETMYLKLNSGLRSNTVSFKVLKV